MLCRKIYTTILLSGLFCIFLSVDAEAANAEEQDFAIIAERTLSETWERIVKHNFQGDKATTGKWQHIYEDAKPTILKSRNSRELVGLINQMIEKLGQSHIHILPPVSKKAKKAVSLQKTNRKQLSVPSSPSKGRSTSAQKDLSKKCGKAAGPGLRLCVADGNLCVLDVAPDSPASAAGIVMGDIINSIHGFRFDLSQYTDYPWDSIADGLLTGNYGTTVELEYTDKNGVHKKVALLRKILYGEWIHLGVMPKIGGRVEYKILDGNIGYIYLTPCFPQQITEMHKIITGKLGNCKGVIIDLRNNPGGMMLMAQGMAGWLSDKELKMGTMKTREYPLKLQSYPQTEAFTGPLAILVNAGTFSTSEVFAAGMQDNKRAKVFGENTGGKCLPSVFFVLSTDYRLQAVFGDFERINGERIERRGVKPDVHVSLSRQKLIKGVDTVRETARTWLIKQ